MSRDKSSRLEPTLIGRTQRFSVHEEERGASEKRRLDGAKLAGLASEPAFLLGERLKRESAEDPHAQASCDNVANQGSQMTLALFVETKFIPEHVQYKTKAGQTHYQAMLKHVMTPETISRIFNPGKRVNARIATRSEWPYLDAIRLCDLRSEHIRRVVSAANRAGYSAQTVKHIKNVCFAVIAHAQKEGCFNGSNPASLVKLPRTTRNASPDLTPKQVEAILKSLHYPHREAALFALTTRMSLPEICDLRWKDVNCDDFDRFVDGQILAARTILVKSWWNRGGLGDSRAFRQNKNIEIREPLLSALRGLRCSNPVAQDDGLVLTSPTGNKLVPTLLRMGEMKRVGRALGMPELTWQDLRRAQQAFLSHLLFQQSPSMPPVAANLLENGPMPLVLARENMICENPPPKSPNVHRVFCFGGRFRTSPGADTWRSTGDGDQGG